MGSSAILVFETLGGIYLLAVLLRFLLQIARADFYNPVSQAVIRITDPMVRIFRSFIPGYRGIDFSSLILALVVEAACICILKSLNGDPIPSVGSVITWAVVGVIYFLLNIYFYAIIAAIIMSFVMLFSGNTNPHPLLRIIWQLTEPVMGPVRRVLPPMGGLDFSPVVILLAIRLLQNFLLLTFDITDQIAAVVIGI